MQFHGYKKEQDVFSVTFLRNELEDISRVMLGVSVQLDKLDRAAMGLYSRDEAMVHAAYMNNLLKSLLPSEGEIRTEVSRTQLLDLADALSGIADTEEEKVCLLLGLDRSAMQGYYRTIWEADKSLVHIEGRFDKKKLNNPEP